jgi:hypothetical protein
MGAMGLLFSLEQLLLQLYKYRARLRSTHPCVIEEREDKDEQIFDGASEEELVGDRGTEDSGTS